MRIAAVVAGVRASLHCVLGGVKRLWMMPRVARK